MKNQKLLFLSETAILTALALLLDMLSSFFIKMPQGGSLSLGMIPIFIMSFRWGLKGGLLTGLLTGILQPILAPAFIVHPAQAILDYPLPFMLAGMSGLFAGWVHSALKQNKWRTLTAVMAATLLGSILRLASHVLSGIVFFGSYAPKGTPVFTYSLVYNSTWMIPTWIVAALAIWLVIMNSPGLIKSNAKKP
ncbi:MULTISPECIES: energy-coupled thiamine transporter ThiT [Bacillaceae]|uniref:Energy-coupled thiamine transporter ThiT n=1 Tax=Metabacillus sediminis TaxID=3117746 RepID=A0ABZ2NEB8_9BACI|nr:energy-coupled thiamine transporter ThiT [Bacillus sp. SJS]KZZ83268.1 energy-coupled thiamine transporter ThiT [Bacillus sp. SJS]